MRSSFDVLYRVTIVSETDIACSWVGKLISMIASGDRLCLIVKQPPQKPIPVQNGMDRLWNRSFGLGTVSNFFVFLGVMSVHAKSQRIVYPYENGRQYIVFCVNMISYCCLKLFIATCARISQ